MAHSAEVRKLLQEHEKEINGYKEAQQLLEDEILNLKQRIQQLETEVSQLDSKIHIRDQEINLMKERVADAKRTMEKCVAEHKLLTQTIEQQYREKEAKL